MNPLRQLRELGQSVWLDYIRRSFLTGGDLDRLIREDDLQGVTANPTIFEKAIAGSTDYDDAIRELLARSRPTDGRLLYEALAVQDVRLAADILQPVYDESNGSDGFVSLEVSPMLAHDTNGTIEEARRLWQTVDRPNLMIKVPATTEGVAAIERLIAEGINVNATLMFSLAHYEAVAAAFIRGVARTANPQRIASVASFFVSRIDSTVDRALEAIGTPEAKALYGKVAIANAKRTYRRYRQLFHGDAFGELREEGTRPQRLLWASTGTKNPAYRDVLYVEELIGRETVNTMPLSTLNAFRDHGVPRSTLNERVEESDDVIAKLSEIGIDFDAITQQLQYEGLEKFAASFNALVDALEQKCATMQSEEVSTAVYQLGIYQAQVDDCINRWSTTRFGRRMWTKDPAAWCEDDVPELTDRLGWLDLPEIMQDGLEDLRDFAQGVRDEGVREVVLLGMGGSSLAPEVFAQTFGTTVGFPTLTVLDTTHPDAVSDAAARLDIARTLFVISSKSGTTLETLSLFRAFWHETGEKGHQFIAITDPETPLQHLAEERGFRRVFQAPPEVGGRYSALSVFGLVPAALIGADIEGLVHRAWTMAEANSLCVPEAHSPGLRLGAALGELALRGRDKITFFTTPALRAFPAWLEQLIAESTGKSGKGIIPVIDEELQSAEHYGTDRFFVALSLNGESSMARESELQRLASAGHPVAHIRLRDEQDLGQEMFRWEVAVAAAGAALGINPFDQPDVQLAKDLARRAMGGDSAEFEATAADAISALDTQSVERALREWIEGARPGDYASIQAYVAPSDSMTGSLQQLRGALRRARPIATTLGYGPRFLHSTGQLHKGGPDTGVFLQLVDEPERDVPVPETDFTFGALIRAQALGDYGALKQRGRRVLRVNLGRDPANSISQLVHALD